MKLTNYAINTSYIFYSISDKPKQSEGNWCINKDASSYDCITLAHMPPHLTITMACTPYDVMHRTVNRKSTYCLLIIFLKSNLVIGFTHKKTSKSY